MLSLISDMDEIMVVMTPMLAHNIFKKYTRYFPERDISDPLPAELDRIVQNCYKDSNSKNLDILLTIYCTLSKSF